MRNVFIIKGHSRDAAELQTDRYYTDRYERFFTSIAGGAYEAAEIHQLEEPMAADLQQVLTAQALGFAVVVLIGHGATQQNRQLFQLNQLEIILAGQIETNSPKQLILLESCRSDINQVLAFDLNNTLPKFKYGGMVRAPISRVTARDLYDQQVGACGNGTMACFACTQGESAWNYYFSAFLLGSAFNWHLGPGPHLEILTIADLVNHVSPLVSQEAVQRVGEVQTPELWNTINFPFAVSKF